MSFIVAVVSEVFIYVVSLGGKVFIIFPRLDNPLHSAVHISRGSKGCVINRMFVSECLGDEGLLLPAAAHADGVGVALAHADPE